MAAGILALLPGCSPADAAKNKGAMADLPTRVEFNAHIRPIFTNKCTSCHGGVKKAGGVSFVYREDALGIGESGRKIITPGDPRDSEIIRRVSSAATDYRMPPADHGEPLSDREVRLLTTWIKQGAEWQEHWAYLPPVAQAPPTVRNAPWARHPIDAFVLARLEAAGLAPAPEQEQARLLRRLSLDLTGLPPTVAALDAFLADGNFDAYERAVDRLLASPHFGERWATPWLDAARYADSQGYERDRERKIWAYRDWVIRMLNADLPYDEFTIKQIAGDLLPDPGPDDLIATAFHRNSMTNAEGGTDDEEFRVVAAIDRVNTTWQAWMGTTFGCTQCHAHPYDPFPNESYYRFLAFFNNTVDHDTPDDYPTVAIANKPDDEPRLFALQRTLAETEAACMRPFQTLSTATPWRPLDYATATSTQDVVLSILRDDNGIELLQTGPDAPRGTVHTTTARTSLPGFTALRIDALMSTDRNVSVPGDPFILSYLEALVIDPDGTETPVKFVRVVADETQSRLWPELSLDKENPRGWAAYPKQHYPHWAVFVSETSAAVPDGASLKVVLHHNESHDGAQQPVLRRFRISLSDDPKWVELAQSDATKEALTRRKETLAAIEEIERTPVPIMRERPAGRERVTHVFARGNWLDQGQQVTAGVPALLHELPSSPTNDRMALARWLVAPENPLTARVAVNRCWEQLFGLGIVETLEDFGSPGLPPSHPELLDFLALRFQNELGWSVKRLLREIVTSATYRQAATTSPEKQEKDPRNKLLSRGPRQRLTAEMTRDNALLVSGLLSRKQFGPPVMPLQPAGVWRTVHNSAMWENSTGEDRYRRAVYTYWKRSTPYPSFVTFDSPSRDVCTSRRIPTNLPLQALVTLNDRYISSARKISRACPRTRRRQGRKRASGTPFAGR
jgi:hypothetical protein